ncbi:MAG: hypothetical protein ISS95_00345 [Candidatus Aenigmarchaeota archaeon]|nr:hypothetical protein [Candidatus Aenigmarchaeota archaeon]
MVVVISHKRAFENAKRALDNFNVEYGNLKKSGRYKAGNDFLFRSYAKKAFEYREYICMLLKERRYGPWSIKDERGADRFIRKMKEMQEKGYLELKEKDITPFDPVTEDIYWEKWKEELSKEIGEAFATSSS